MIVTDRTLTNRQYIAMRLCYGNGATHRQIAGLLGITHRAVQTLINRGNEQVKRDAGDAQGVAKSVLVRGLFRPPPAISLAGHAGRAALRQEELWGELELLMQQRAEALADIEECMSCGSDSSTRRRGSSCMCIVADGTRWPPEKWEPPGPDGQQYGSPVTLPCDDC